MKKQLPVTVSTDSIYRRMTTEIREITREGFKWLDITKPTARELNLLMDEFDFPENVLEDCLSEHQRSKVDAFSNFTFAIVYFPVYKQDLKRIEPEEIDFFIGKDFLITLHEGSISPIVSLATLCQEKNDIREKYMGLGSAMLMVHIHSILLECCFPLLDRINEPMEFINRHLFKNRSTAMLEEISRIKADIMSFRMIIQPLRNVLQSLQAATNHLLPQEYAYKANNILHNVDSLWSMLNNYKEVIENYDNTYASLTNQRINKLMRTFTILQILITPVVITNMLFSINVGGIPFANSMNGFWVLLCAIFFIITLISTILFIKRNKWL